MAHGGSVNRVEDYYGVAVIAVSSREYEIGHSEDSEIEELLRYLWENKLSFTVTEGRLFLTRYELDELAAKMVVV